jgi:hypothetical protein
MISKRQGMMQQVLTFIMQHLTSNATHHQIDGALHMIAVVSTQLLKSKVKLISLSNYKLHTRTTHFLYRSIKRMSRS